MRRTAYLVLTAHGITAYCSLLTAYCPMAWIIAFTILIFYALATWVFHATGLVRFLPILAVAVLLVDRLLIWKYGQPPNGSGQR